MRVCTYAAAFVVVGNTGAGLLSLCVVLRTYVHLQCTQYWFSVLGFNKFQIHKIVIGRYFVWTSGRTGTRRDPKFAR